VTARIEHLVTSGTFSLDGGTWEVDNNVWIVAASRRVPRPISRWVRGCTG